MKRRRILSLSAASLAAVAGCAATPDDTLPTDGSDPDGSGPGDGGNRSSTDDSISVASVAVRPGVVALTTDDSIGVLEPDGRVVVARIAVAGEDPPAHADFELDTGPNAYGPVQEIAGATLEHMLFGHGKRYPADDGSAGWVVWSVPAPAAVDGPVRITWPDGEYRLGADVATALTRPVAAFEADLSAPDSLDRGRKPVVTLTARNTADVDGWFVAGVNHAGPHVASAPLEPVAMSVTAGEERTWTKIHDVSTAGGSDEIRYFANWIGGNDSTVVRLVSESTTVTVGGTGTT